MNGPRIAPNHHHATAPKHLSVPTVAPWHLNPPARFRRFVIDIEPRRLPAMADQWRFNRRLCKFPECDLQRVASCDGRKQKQAQFSKHLPDHFRLCAFCCIRALPTCQRARSVCLLAQPGRNAEALRLLAANRLCASTLLNVLPDRDEMAADLFAAHDGVALP